MSDPPFLSLEKSKARKMKWLIHELELNKLRLELKS